MPFGFGLAAPYHLGRNDLVAVAINIRSDLNSLTDDPFDSEAAAVNRGDDLLYMKGLLYSSAYEGVHGMLALINAFMMRDAATRVLT